MVNFWWYFDTSIYTINFKYLNVLTCIYLRSPTVIVYTKVSKFKTYHYFEKMFHLQMYVFLMLGVVYIYIYIERERERY